MLKSASMPDDEKKPSQKNPSWMFSEDPATVLQSTLSMRELEGSQGQGLSRVRPG
jgi:hypothetical protein